MQAAGESKKPASTPEVPLRQSPERWVLMALLVTGMIFSYAQRGALSVATPALIRDLDLTRAEMGLLLSAFSWFYCFMQLPAGWIVDRFGVKRAYAISFAFWSIASALTGLARSLVSLIFFRLLLGLGQSVIFPASARAVANWFQDRERGTVTASYLAGVRVGTALIGALGAYLLASHGWQSFFLLTGIVPLLWLAPWWIFLRKWDRQAPDPDSRAREAAKPPGASFISGMALLKNRTVLGILIGFFAYDYAWFVYLSWLPGYLVLERKVEPGQLAVFSSVPYLAMSIIILISGFASDWLIRRGYAERRVRKLFVITGLAVGCLVVPAGLVEDNGVAVWLLTVSLCGLGIASPNTWTLTQAVCSKKIVGTVSGIQNFGGNIGGIIAPALTGYIADETGSFAMALSIMGAMLLAGIAAYAFLISDPVEAEPQAG